MRSVPFDDPSVRDLSDAERSFIAGHWRRRALAEARVGFTFSKLAPLVARAGGTARVVAMLEASAAEESRHAELCLRLAEAYGGAPPSPIDPVELGPCDLPRFGVGDDALEAHLLVVGTCAINETMATAWISACLEVATAPIAIEANRAHLRDEIDHARVGWAHLASNAVGATHRAAIADLLPAMLEANAPQWEPYEPGLPERGIPAHGHLGPAATRAALREAISEVLLPGFRHVGVDTRPAEAWFARFESGPTRSVSGPSRVTA